MHWPAVSTKMKGEKNADKPKGPLCIRKFWQSKSWQFLLPCRLELSYSYARYYYFQLIHFAHHSFVSNSFQYPRTCSSPINQALQQIGLRMWLKDILSNVCELSTAKSAIVIILWLSASRGTRSGQLSYVYGHSKLPLYGAYENILQALKLLLDNHI